MTTPYYSDDLVTLYHGDCPFAGSGATLIAARNLGRKVIGVEVEERYCDLIVSRLAQQAFDFASLDTPRMFPAIDEVRSSGWSGSAA